MNRDFKSAGRVKWGYKRIEALWKGAPDPPIASESPVWLEPPVTSESPVWPDPSVTSESPVWPDPPVTSESPVWLGRATRFQLVLISLPRVFKRSWANMTGHNTGRRRRQRHSRSYPSCKCRRDASRGTWSGPGRSRWLKARIRRTTGVSLLGQDSTRHNTMPSSFMLIGSGPVTPAPPSPQLRM